MSVRPRGERVTITVDLERPAVPAVGGGAERPHTFEPRLPPDLGKPPRALLEPRQPVRSRPPPRHGSDHPCLVGGPRASTQRAKQGVDFLLHLGLRPRFHAGGDLRDQAVAVARRAAGRWPPGPPPRSCPRARRISRGGGGIRVPGQGGFEHVEECALARFHIVGLQSLAACAPAASGPIAVRRAIREWPPRPVRGHNGLRPRPRRWTAAASRRLRQARWPRAPLAADVILHGGQQKIPQPPAFAVGPRPSISFSIR